MEVLSPALNKLSLQDKKITIFYHYDTLLHQSSKKHPEQPNRITAILETLQKKPSLIFKNVAQSQPPPNYQEIQKIIAQLQGQKYLQFVQQMWDPNTKKTEVYINTDTYYCKHSYRSAIAAAATTIAAVDHVLVNQQAKAFSVVRPPGHHSGLKSQPHGFSFLNNIAVAAFNAIKTKTASRIAIIDWDVHHGQGTQNLFYNSSQVLYISLHRFDKGKYFPHIPQSSSEYIGQDKGKGFNINICWNLPEKAPNSLREPHETVGNSEYKAAFDKIILPVLKEYNPDLILISCGFDSAEGDPLGGVKITSKGYEYMTRQLNSLNKPLALVLQGGYDLSILQWGSQAVIDGLSLQKQKQEIQIGCNQIGQQGIENCLKIIRSYWKCLLTNKDSSL